MSEVVPQAFLVVTMVVEPDFEEEFNRWYNEEHYPERMSVPGFLRGTRMVTHGEDGTQYLAMYELTDASVLDSAEYQAIGGKGTASPWTLSVVRHLVSMDRRIYTNITPSLPAGATPA